MPIKTLYKSLLLAFAFFVFGAVFIKAVSVEQGAFATELPNKDEIIIRTENGEEHIFNVELALTPKEQEIGLMHRTSLADNAGMLFIFKDEKRPSFWMKNTLIPLDLLFLSHDGRIHHIHTNAKPQDLSLITSKEKSRAVLEISGGTADRLGIKSGDQILHKVFRNTEIQ